MIKKILLLTTIYPTPEQNYGTFVVHYFTREWVKMGYDVKVIHYQTVYPSFFYVIAKLFREKIASLTNAVVNTKRERSDKCYMMEGVTVYSLPIFKLIPHGKFSKSVIDKQIKKITNSIIDKNNIPDIIIGHFSNPQLEIISRLKTLYSSKTCIVMHDKGDSIKSIYKQNYNYFFSNIDVWGFRSISIQKGFEANFGKMSHSFLCYSGIPNNYLNDLNLKTFKGELRKFVFAGEFIKLKNIRSIINAIKDIYPDKKYEISLIGKGNEEFNIKHQVNLLGINSCVKFHGWIPRDETQEIFNKSDCFIMISGPEAFGLVYIEAMGKGCITIGSRNEGIDGIIRHGENGFLCEAGNEYELAEIIQNINNLTEAERIRISINAISTAKEMTDFNVAKEYIEAIFNI